MIFENSIQKIRKKPQVQPKMFKNVKMNMLVLEKMFQSDEQPEWKRDFRRKNIKNNPFRSQNELTVSESLTIV